MREASSRSPGAGEPSAAAGWRIARLVSPSPLFGSNGMNFGPDGWLYVAECFGSQITAVNPSSGERKIVSPRGGEIVGPDDLAFDSHGVMYITEFPNHRVCALMPNGEARVVWDPVPGANGITVHKDRVFVDQCRAGGQLLEMFTDGRAPRLMADNLAMPNACAVGPDERLYYPLILSGEVWRVALDGGEPERVVGGLATPPALKFDHQGRLVVLESHTGEVSRIDLRSGQKTCLAKLRDGLDNVAIAADDRIFVSSFAHGGVVEIAPGGEQKVLVPSGLIGPWGLAWSGGGLLIGDGPSIMKPASGGGAERVAWLGNPGFPGMVRGLAAGPDGRLYVTNTAGNVAVYDPTAGSSQVLAEGMDCPFGIACSGSGAVIAVEGGAGRVWEIAERGRAKVIASGLDRPTGIALASDGTCYVSETGRHRVVRINGGVETVVDGIDTPQGLALDGDSLLVVDAGGRHLTEVGIRERRRTVLASNLPVGNPGGPAPKVLKGVPGIFPGPIVPFAGVVVGSDGRIYIAGDADGSVLALQRVAQ